MSAAPHRLTLGLRAGRLPVALLFPGLGYLGGLILFGAGALAWHGPLLFALLAGLFAVQLLGELLLDRGWSGPGWLYRRFRGLGPAPRPQAPQPEAGHTSALMIWSGFALGVGNGLRPYRGGLT